MNSDEFYIGYAPPMPPHIARFVKRAVMMIAAGVPLAASLIAIGHVRLDGGTFDYGRPQTIVGVITTRPYPAIRLEPPSASASAAAPDAANEQSGAGADTGGGRDRWALLVAPGKHGADALMTPFDGQHVTLDATRIQRGTSLMFEVAPGTIAASAATAVTRVRRAATKASEGSEGEALARTTSIAESVAYPPGNPPPDATVAGARGHRHKAASGPITLRGEIVDSKCFLGVMTPGEGKTHKDCASLCLRGGIPPAFAVRDREGRMALLLLVSESGGSLAGHAAALRFAGEPIEVTGVVEDQIDDEDGNEGEITPAAAGLRGWRMLRTNPSTWRPLGTPVR